MCGCPGAHGRMLRDIVARICPKHSCFSSNVSCTDESENAQPYQHLKPSHIHNKSGKYLTTKETQPKNDATRKFPAVQCPAGNELSIFIWWFWWWWWPIICLGENAVALNLRGEPWFCTPAVQPIHLPKRPIFRLIEKLIRFVVRF